MEPTQNLIYDRSFKDVQRVAELNRKISAGSASAEEVQEWFSAKGALNYEDLNRIESWTEFLSNQLKSYGYNAPITKRAEQTYTYYEKPEPGDEPSEPVSRLPEGYRELTYIESTGTQYIDTGYIAQSDNLKIAIRFAYTSVATGQSIFGAQNSTGTPYGIIPYISEAGKAYLYVATSSKILSTSVSVNTVNTWEISAINGSASWNVNGTTSKASYSGAPNQAFQYFIFANNSGGSMLQPCSAKLYLMQMYDNDVLVRDYIPCRNPSGDVGLYDTVTKQFFGNAGTGVFKQGEAVVSLPEGYERAQYIESTGTQWIDTGYALSNNSRVIMSADLTNYSTNTYGNSFFGARSSDGSNAFLVICGTSANANWTIMYGNNSGNATIVAAGRHEIDFNKNVCIIDGKSVSITASSFNCAYPCFLFTDNRGGTANTGNNSRLKLYACQIYDNGTLVRDYVPCVNVQGTAGLYDMANDVFYANAGTGTFVTGEVIEYIENVGGGSNGPTAITVTYTDWRVWDIPHLAEINRIRDNVNSLRYGFYNLSDWREIVYKNNPNFEDVNTLEWDMQTIYNWLKLMILNFKYSGEAYAGEAW